MTMSLFLQILAAYVAASLTVGFLFGVALGRLISRGDRRREQEVALLARILAGRRVASRRSGPPAVAPVAIPAARTAVRL
jgi:hypothetical protein